MKGLYIAPFTSFALYNAFYDGGEKKVIKSDLMKKLSLKYRFSSFDFQDSKRSSSLLALRSAIRNDSTVLNIAPQ